MENEKPVGFERVEDIPGFETLTENDAMEIRKFAALLKAKAAVKRGEALDAPELLNAVVYGSPTGEPFDDSLFEEDED